FKGQITVRPPKKSSLSMAAPGQQEIFRRGTWFPSRIWMVSRSLFRSRISQASSARDTQLLPGFLSPPLLRSNFLQARHQLVAFLLRGFPTRSSPGVLPVLLVTHHSIVPS